MRYKNKQPWMCIFIDHCGHMFLDAPLLYSRSSISSNVICQAELKALFNWRQVHLFQAFIIACRNLLLYPACLGFQPHRLAWFVSHFSVWYLSDWSLCRVRNVKRINWREAISSVDDRSLCVTLVIHLSHYSASSLCHLVYSLHWHLTFPIISGYMGISWLMRNWNRWVCVVLP